MKPRQKKNVTMDLLTNTRRITRSVSLRNGRGNSLPIPIEIIIIIFSKLDLKSIAKCRCVSKLWASILRSSDFTELFLSMSCSSSQKLLLVYQSEGKLFFYSSPQPQNPDENLSPLVPNYLMKFSFSGDCDDMDLVHGLVCLNYTLIEKSGVESFLKIYNPSTGQVLVLPNVKSNRNRVFSSLGYDPIGKQFKIMSMVQPGRYNEVCEKYQVLILGTQNMSWRMIECGIPHHFPHQHIFINGVLYYTSIDWYTKTCTVVCFDVRFEKFSFIKTPETFNAAVNKERYDMINYNGKLGLLQFYVSDGGFFFFAGSDIKLKLWILEDNEKQNWCEHTFVFSTMPDNIVENVILRFVGVTEKQEIVMLSYAPSYLFYLNIEKNTIVRVKIEGIDEYIDHIFLDHLEDVKIY